MGRPKLGNERVEIKIPGPLFEHLVEEAGLRGITHQRLIVDILVARDLGGLVVAPAQRPNVAPTTQDLAEQNVGEGVTDEWF